MKKPAVASLAAAGDLKLFNDFVKHKHDMNP